MKKSLLLFILLISSTLCFAEKKVASYTSFQTKYDIEAAINEAGELRVYVEIIGEYEHDKVMFKIDGEKDVITFQEKLRECKAKFIEWNDVAKQNNITSFRKEMDITFPNIEIYWRSSSKWHSSYSRNFFKPIFLINEEGESSFGVVGTATDWDNKYIDQKFYFLLESTEAFDSIINALDVEKIKGALNKDENTDALFK